MTPRQIANNHGLRQSARMKTQAKNATTNAALAQLKVEAIFSGSVLSGFFQTSLRIRLSSAVIKDIYEIVSAARCATQGSL